MENLHEIAVRLCEGQAVWFNLHMLRAVDYHGDGVPCYDCSMDCICNDDIANLCAECDVYHHHKHYLDLILSHAKKTR